MSGAVCETMYKSRLYIKMCFRPRFSNQVFRNRGAYRQKPRDLYMESAFRCCSFVQARLVHRSSVQPNRAPCPITCTHFRLNPIGSPSPASSVHKSTAQCPCPCTLRECTHCSASAPHTLEKKNHVKEKTPLERFLRPSRGAFGCLVQGRVEPPDALD